MTRRPDSITFVYRLTAMVLASVVTCLPVQAQPEPAQETAVPVSATEVAVPTSISATDSNAFASATYTLAAGDRVEIRVFDEPDLSGSFDLDTDGAVNLPLVGLVPLAGLDAKGAAQALTTRLADGFLVSPRVDVRVLRFRTLRVTGAVHRPGTYPYRENMTVADAVLAAGGLTERAKDAPYKLNRLTSGELNPPASLRVPSDAPLQPDDVLQVDERFF